MNRRELLQLLGSSAMAFGVGDLAGAKTSSRKKVLMFTKSSGFEHSVIKRANGRLAFAEQVVVDLGNKNGFQVNATKDGRIFGHPELADYDVFFFYTTGDLTTAGEDKNPPMTAEGKRRFLDLVQEGKGFIGTHSASDTFHSPGAQSDPRPLAHLDPYIQMLGGEFITHNEQQKARLKVVDGNFPGMKPLGSGTELTEEWYSLRNFAPDLHVLTVLETTGMQGPAYQRPPFPNTWARLHGRGRVFYTALGHREDVWDSGVYQGMLLGALRWSLRRVEAAAPPNLAKVAPGARELPKAAFH